jgi:hypothetical protein
MNVFSLMPRLIKELWSSETKDLQQKSAHVSKPREMMSFVEKEEDKPERRLRRMLK